MHATIFCNLFRPSCAQQTQIQSGEKKNKKNGTTAPKCINVMSSEWDRIAGRLFSAPRAPYTVNRTARFRSSFRSFISVFIVFAFFGSVFSSYYYVQFHFIFNFYPFCCVYSSIWLLFFRWTRGRECKQLSKK